MVIRNIILLDYASALILLLLLLYYYYYYIMSTTLAKELHALTQSGKLK